jgi:uncharacterized protein YjbI with pentapeptide repeats
MMSVECQFSDSQPNMCHLARCLAENSEKKSWHEWGRLNLALRFNVDFENANFNNVDFENVDFQNVDLQNVDL